MFFAFRKFYLDTQQRAQPILDGHLRQIRRSLADQLEFVVIALTHSGVHELVQMASDLRDIPSFLAVDTFYEVSSLFAP